MRSALVFALAIGCSSQPAPAPTPAPTPEPAPTGGTNGESATPDEQPPPDPPPEPTGDEVIAQFSAIKDTMCGCRDKACAESANKEFEEWLKANETAKGSAGQQERAMKIAEEYTMCMMSAMTGGPAQGKKCAPGDWCASGLTCMKYYGVAGAAGPELTSCEIPCGAGKPACPTGQSCKTIADGPGQVCRQ